jgi:hypothetical protein
VNISKLRVIEQRHEAEIHVQLLMAVEQGQPGIIRAEVHFDLLVAGEYDDVFEHTGILPQ